MRTVNLPLALLCLVTPHMFFRFLGFSFLVPGVVSASLSKSWTVPTGYGDVAGGILAIVAVIAGPHGNVGYRSGVDIQCMGHG